MNFEEASAEAILATLRTMRPVSDPDAAERFEHQFERVFTHSPMYEVAAGHTYFVSRLELQPGHWSVGFGIAHRHANLLLRVTHDDGGVYVPEVVYCAISRNDDADDCQVVPVFSTRPLTAAETEAVRSRLSPNARFKAVRADAAGHA